ncbi:MAG: GC-type dockerin domain-anchored protein [Planctomyces sp.]
MKSSSIRFCATGLLLALAGTTFAATKTFTNGGGDGLWSNAANWSDGSLPKAADDVIIPAGASAVTVDGTFSVNSITISGGRALAVDGSLTTTASITGGSISLNLPGTLLVGADLAGASFTFNGGQVGSGLNTRNTNVTINSTEPTIIRVRGTATVSGDLADGQTLSLTAENPLPTNVTWNGSPTVRGRLLFAESAVGSTTNLSIGGTLTVEGAPTTITGPGAPAANGRIEFAARPNSSPIFGNISSSGQIEVRHRATFAKPQAAPSAIFENSGFIVVSDSELTDNQTRGEAVGEGFLHLQGPNYTFENALPETPIAPIVAGGGLLQLVFGFERVSADRIQFVHSGGAMLGNMTLTSSQALLETTSRCVLIFRGQSSLQPSGSGILGANTALISPDQAIISQATDASPQPVLTITHPDPNFSITNTGIIATHSATIDPASINSISLPLPTINAAPFVLAGDIGPGPGPLPFDPALPEGVFAQPGTLQTAPSIAGSSEVRLGNGLLNFGALLIGSPTTIRGTTARFENRLVTIVTENFADLIGGQLDAIAGGPPPAPVVQQARLTTSVAEVFQDSDVFGLPIVAGRPPTLFGGIIGAENVEIIGGRFNYLRGLILNEVGGDGPGVWGLGGGDPGVEPYLRINSAVVDFREPPSTTVQGRGNYGGLFELVGVCNLISDIPGGIEARVTSIAGSFPASRTNVTKTTFAIRGTLSTLAAVGTTADITSFGPVLVDGLLDLGPRSRMGMDTMNPASSGTLNIRIQSPGTNTADIGRIDSTSRFTLLGNVRFQFLDGFAPDLCSFISAPFISTTRTMSGTFATKFPFETAIQIFSTAIGGQVVRTARINGCACTVPNITVEPLNRAANVGDTVAFEIQATGTPVQSLTYQWFRNGTPLVNGGTAPQIIGSNLFALALFNVQPGDTGTYSVTVSNACGSDTASATLVVNAPSTGCSLADIANTDGDPIPDGVIDNGDFNAFFAAFFADNLLADVANTDGDPTPDGVIDNGDFNAFFSAFFAGCPTVP